MNAEPYQLNPWRNAANACGFVVRRDSMWLRFSSSLQNISPAAGKKLGCAAIFHIKSFRGLVAYYAIALTTMIRLQLRCLCGNIAVFRAISLGTSKAEAAVSLRGWYGVDASVLPELTSGPIYTEGR